MLGFDWALKLLFGRLNATAHHAHQKLTELATTGIPT
jgi:hypothetical protein